MAQYNIDFGTEKEMRTDQWIAALGLVIAVATILGAFVALTLEYLVG